MSLTIRPLFSRIRGIGKGGVSLSDAHAKVQDNPALEVKVPFEKQFDALAVSPLQMQREQNIHAELNRRNLGLDSDRVKLLVRALAACALNAEFERLSFSIYGTQLQFLVVLNAALDGMKIGDVKEWYLKNVQPNNEILQEVPFDTYFGFLKRNLLVAVEGESVQITPYGIDFMQYLVRTRQTGTRPN